MSTRGRSSTIWFIYATTMPPRNAEASGVSSVKLRRIHTCQEGGEKIGLLLIVAFDRHADAGFDDGLQQGRCQFRRTDIPLVPLSATARARREARFARRPEVSDMTGLLRSVLEVKRWYETWVEISTIIRPGRSNG
jgi:hypothetical protein